MTCHQDAWSQQQVHSPGRTVNFQYIRVTLKGQQGLQSPVSTQLLEALLGGVSAPSFAPLHCPQKE